MTHLLAVAAGGAAGALARYGLTAAVHAVAGRTFPWGTLAANVLGSFAMGLLYVLLLERSAASPEARALLLTGLLGAFTTFSTFTVETLNLVEAGALGRAAANVLASVALCLLAAWIGMGAGRQL
ncbi:MAG TPA: fluoride efflux transporter CrcB [Chromatiales bacterium]|nr:fluoride efflux transporter CrcB [Chromatiales bacterium]